MIFIYLISGLFLGWSLGANDTGNIFGAAVETRMLRFKKAALIAAIFISLGAILEGSGPSQTLGRLGSVDALGGAFTVALSAAAAITVMVRLRIRSPHLRRLWVQSSAGTSSAAGHGL
jgi:PiT family inorganic phosphate transporter